MSYCKTVGNGFVIYTQKKAENVCIFTGIEFTKKFKDFVFPKKDHLGRIIIGWGNLPRDGSTENWPDTITIPNTVLVLGRMNNLPCETLIMPDSIKVIDAYQFMGSKKLSKIVLPPKTEIIGKTAFALCGSDKNPCKIIMPDTVAHIGTSSFQHGHLEYFRWPRNTPKIDNYVFRGSVIDVLDLSGAVIDSVELSAFEGCSIRKLILPYYPCTKELYEALDQADIAEK